MGFYGHGYVEERLVTGLPFQNVLLERKRDLFNALTFAQRKLFLPPKATELINCLHYDLGVANVDLNHLVNAISLSSTPWVVSYEHYLPRWNKESAPGWRRLASPSCRKIIAISKWSLRFQEYLLEQHPDLREAVSTKLCLLTPSQEMLITRYDDKVLDPDRITFTMVGGDFFRKGGMEILEVFSELAAEKLPFHLTIVSTLAYGDYASKTTRSDYERARALIARLGDHVTHWHSLENHRVRELFTRSHVGLLRTYNDTYGFSVLEAQGAGCPVITTDGAALPEFNNDSIGWMISVPKDGQNDPRYRTPADRQVLSACIRASLRGLLRSICTSPAAIRTKGEHALAWIRQHCRPEDRVMALEKIYHEALL